MAFEFIDNNARIDRKTRKRIRSLVATGKNAGKTVVRPSRIKAYQAQSNHTAILPNTREQNKITENESDSSPDSHNPEIQRQIGDILCFMTSADQLSPAARTLAKRAIAFMISPRHAPALDRAFDLSGAGVSKFIGFMFVDEAFFHCAIALSVTAINSLTARADESREAIQHLCRTFRIISERLALGGISSISTIATVLMLAQYERHQSQHYQGLVHLNGLRKLIHTRGGTSEIAKSMPILMQKAFRIDLDYALYMGTTTMFQVEHVVANGMLIPQLRGKLPDSDRSSSTELQRLSEYLNPDLYDLLLDLKILSRQLNDASAAIAPKVNIFGFNARLIGLGYRIVSISSFTESYNLNRLENAVHLGLGMFVTSFMNKLDRKIPDMPFLAELLRSLVKYGFEDDQFVLLWILFLGDATILNHTDHEWLVPMIATVALNLNLHNWDDILIVLAQFPWIHALYDKSAQDLWFKTLGHLSFPYVVGSQGYLEN